MQSLKNGVVIGKFLLGSIKRDEFKMEITS